MIRATDSNNNAAVRRAFLLLSFSDYRIATMQSVVIGKAPITLEWKITSGGKKYNKYEYIT